MKKTKSIVLATVFSSILSSSLTGCGLNSSYFYQEDQYGSRELIGYFTPDDIDSLYIVNIKDIEDNRYSYISNKIVADPTHAVTSGIDEFRYDRYYNVFNEQLICYGNNEKNKFVYFENEIPLFEYLAVNNIQKGKYTKDDLETILNDYQENKNSKKLTK